MPATPIDITSADHRYDALRRGFNQRWIAEPDNVFLAASTEDVVAALTAYLSRPAGKRRRITVRSGGHCYEDFVCSADVGVIIDVSQMDGVTYDSEMKAYCIEAGATNWGSTTRLYRSTGLALPGGSCSSVGLGGHISGGGYGLLSRLHGLTVDYLYAVEVVTVPDGRKPVVKVARKDSKETDLQDLWWGHTGGGGGNFGVITRYWFRGLPEPPAQVLLQAVAWKWDDFLKHPAAFKGLVRRYGEFFEYEHAGTGGPEFLHKTDYSDMFTLLRLTHRSAGKVGLTVQLDGTRKDSPKRLKDFLTYITQDFSSKEGKHFVETKPLDLAIAEHGPQTDWFTATSLPWLTATQSLNDTGPNRCGKYKSAYMTSGFTQPQIDAIHHHLTNEYNNPTALLQVDSYGGKINKTAPDATAVPQRSSVLKLQYQTYWSWNTDANKDGVHDYKDAEVDPEIAAPHLKWIRDFYRAVYKNTGGVPAVADPQRPETKTVNTDGCYISYPDVDLSDTTEQNTSGQAWSQLYYKDNYERLQRVKKRWDPHNIFHHAQSIAVPADH
ncbi:FAD-binding oxidoreductase [Streptomyces sp. NPDC003016]